MAVVAFCSDPSNLIRQLKRAIIEGHVVTWSVDQDGDLTHSTGQWKNHAWMRPRLGVDKVIFNILPPRTQPISRETYAIYHGRLIEMLLAHFDRLISSVAATSMPTFEDRVK